MLIGPIIVETCLYSTSKSIMISAVTFVLGGLAILSTMGPLHFVVAEYPRHAYQHCLDEGFQNHCLFDFIGYDKYICKKLVCAQNEGGTMIAIDSGKVPDEGSPCLVSVRADNTMLVQKICKKGFCRRVTNESNLKFSGALGRGIDCWNRRGELFTGGSINRAEKCSSRP